MVTITRTHDSFQLLRDGAPYYIKGAVAFDHYLDRIPRCGGNSIRTGRLTRERLDRLHALGLSVLVNLPLREQRSGMDYDDSEAVARQRDKVLSVVDQLKDHPAVLMWALGNELDFNNQAADFNYNPRVWDAVNALSTDIHARDGAHPTLTVVGSLSEEKTRRIKQQCPDLDLLGINEYGDLPRIPSRLRRYGWEKPYIVTEWGPTGFWQVPKTAWDVPIEETSTRKAELYRRRYHQAILADRKRCLGSYVFLWQQHQERTHTWFGMFDEQGNESESVEVMFEAWSGNSPVNRAPRIHLLTIDGKPATDSVILGPGQRARAQVEAIDPDSDAIRFVWEVLKEGTTFPYGGQGEPKPPAVPEAILQSEGDIVDIRTPAPPGPYRLFVYVYDGRGHFATANIPFLVKDQLA